MKSGNEHIKAINFICGGGSMMCELRQAGIDVIVRIDFDSNLLTKEYELCL